ncbi:MAG: YabP/YqfC family sporulation protein [Clostridia bacterium]|nr:YabP/YqfC family sporulation protein [Clostridia bacterium]
MQQEFLPREVASDVPRMTLTGGERLFVEQHKGLLDCREELISLKTASGILCVEGCHLMLLRYSRVEALITGDIRSLSLQPDGRRS